MSVKHDYCFDENVLELTAIESLKSKGMPEAWHLDNLMNTAPNSRKEPSSESHSWLSNIICHSRKNMRKCHCK